MSYYPTKSERNELSVVATTGQVAAYLELSAGYLEKMRYEGKGPPYLRIGRSIRYRWADVDAWLENSVCHPSKEKPS